MSETGTGIIEDFAEVVVGGTPATNRAEFWNGNVVWVTPTDITSRSEPTLFQSARTITEQGVARSSARVVPAGSVLVTTRATVGPAVLAGCDVATSQGVTALVPGPLVHGPWLYYWVATHQREFISRGAGNTFPEVSRSKTKLIPIEVPDLDTQRDVAGAGTRVDAYLAALRRQQDALQVLLSATRERLIGQHVDGTRPLGDELDGIEGGRSPLCESRVPSPGEPGVLKVSAVRPGFYGVWEAKPLPAGAVMPAVAKVALGDVLITRANTRALVGAVCRVHDTPEPRFLCDKTLRLRPSETLDSDYLVEVLTTRTARRQIEAAATGTSESMKNISQATIRAVQVPLPDLEHQRETVAALTLHRRQLDATQRLVETAVALRRSLLHSLFYAPDRLLGSVGVSESAGALVA